MNWETLAGIVALGFGLSLDNFRSSIALGTVPFGWRRAVEVALVFGFWDLVSPVAGGWLGNLFGEAIGKVAVYIGPALLGIYGLYLLISMRWRTEPERIDHPWVTLFGMPLALSVDNLLAGAGLGLFGISPVVPAVIFGVMTAVMSLAGLFIGRAVGRVIPIRADLVSGLSLLTAAVVLPLAFSNG